MGWLHLEWRWMLLGEKDREGNIRSLGFEGSAGDRGGGCLRRCFCLEGSWLVEDLVRILSCFI